MPGDTAALADDNHTSGVRRLIWPRDAKAGILALTGR